METIRTGTKNRGQEFVSFVLSRIQKDTAYGAALRRADNPATEYQSWEYLAHWCDIDKDWERRPFEIIAAAVARAKPKADGKMGMGMALAACYEKGNQAEPAKARLRRLLACCSAKEACDIMRSFLSLIASRGVSLNYGQLLNDLLYFGEGEKIKEKWAVEFYGRRANDSISA